MYLKINDYHDKVEAYQVLKKLRLPYIICVESLFRKRSINQNKYYHRYILKVLSDEVGRFKSEIEEELLLEFACVGTYKDEENNVVYEIEKTSDMTTIRFEEYCEDCRRYAQIKYDVYLLAPNEVIQDALELHGKTKRIIRKREE